MSLSERELQSWIADRTGLDAQLLAKPWLTAHMHQRLHAHGRECSAASYRDLLQEDPNELEWMRRQVAVPETWFFRYPASFEYLAMYLKQRRTQGSITTIRMLSIACATGEEPISLAVTAAFADWPLANVRIDAVDSDSQCVQDARHGRFSQHAVRNDLPSWSTAWIQADKAGIKVDPSVISTIQWHHFDIMSPPPSWLHARYEVIFCRNLLVYLNEVSRAALIERLNAWLAPGGRLFVGHADALDRMRSHFQPIEATHAFVFEPRSRASRDAARRFDPAGVVPPVPRFKARRPDWSSDPPARDSSSFAPSSKVQLIDDRRTEDIDEGQTEDDVPPLERAARLADEGKLLDALTLTQQSDKERDARFFALQGSILMALRRFDEAKDVLRKALYLDPHHEESLLQMSVLHQSVGNHDLAGRYRQRAAMAHHQHREKDEG